MSFNSTDRPLGSQLIKMITPQQQEKAKAAKTKSTSSSAKTAKANNDKSKLLIEQLQAAATAGKLQVKQAPEKAISSDNLKELAGKNPIPKSYKLLDLPLPTQSTQALSIKSADGTRDIPLNIFYPTTGKGPFPTIIFSHGGAAANDFYDYIGKHFAESGYVVIMPEHTKSNTENVIAVNEQAVSQQEQTPVDQNGDGIVDDDDNLTLAYQLYKDHDQRTSDISQIINKLSTIESALPAIKGKLDKNNIGMAGHSMGAQTTMLLAGTEEINYETGERFNYSDPRIKAFLAISPAAYGSGLGTMPVGVSVPDPASYAKITRPVMTLVGEYEPEDMPSPDPRVPDILAPYKTMPANGNKYNISVAKAEHQDFAGPVGQILSKRFLDGGYLSAHVQVLNNGVAFMDAFLKNDTTAQSYLKNDMANFAKTLGSTASAK